MDSAVWQRIELAAGHKGWTSAELARRAGCSKQAVSHIKNNTSKGGRIFPKLALALEVDAEWLRSGDARVMPPWLAPAPYDSAVSRRPAAKRGRERVAENTASYDFEHQVLERLAEHGQLLRRILKALRSD